MPRTGDENVRINLWLHNGNQPTDTNEVKFILRSFQFIPLGQAQPAVLTQPQSLTDGRFQCAIAGQMGRWYQVQASSNLFVWQSIATILVTNSAMDFVETNAVSSAERFFRVVALP